MQAIDSNTPRFVVVDDRQSLEGGAPTQIPVRNALWVLRWAAAVATLFTSFILIAEFFCHIGAEQTLARAARVAALEATLPRASYQSVRQTVERQLNGLAPSTSLIKVYLSVNGTPVGATFVPAPGDHVAVSLALSKRTVLPGWLQMLSSWHADSLLEAHAERHMPGRGLQAAVHK